MNNVTPITAAESGPFLPAFRFVEFNPRRARRGAEAARVEVTYDEGDVDFLWMSPSDIRKNIAEFGNQEGLKQALEAYGRSA
ncbi:hypothetical protein [Billgrantia gudaonensis]|uniref:Uncharacterized protein n=1 Tax=Billgrantia gudaonensis TaxID=376427 RepID=A0A1G8XFT3_9GAMM|nr:hypothetical protein [Halomonas gudaonensis]SDJ89448.1 hypothetical protein SAMN04487954_10928 [Halomonas gudaonensis]